MAGATATEARWPPEPVIVAFTERGGAWLISAIGVDRGGAP
ncbi:MAG TPA: hypothetical protein VEZ14_04370 [Dehalococcoidia bacterium]|nr:hypothetical protein [Dehalococcoidia bacterium]